VTGVDVQEAISRAHRALEALLTVARDTATSSESAAVAARETVWAATAARAADERDRQAQRALGVTAPDAELVALRIGGNHPSAAVWPALVVDHPGTDAQELVDLLVASARERHEIKMYPVPDVPGSGTARNSRASDPSGESSRASGLSRALPLSGSSLNPVSCNQNCARRQGSAQSKLMLLMRTANGATFRRWRHLRLRSVTIQAACQSPRCRVTSGSRWTIGLRDGSVVTRRVAH